MLDEELKNHRKRLELAINEALTDSTPVRGVIQDIRAQGYDVFLIIEATIGLSRNNGDPHEGDRLEAARLELTSEDQRFLRSLKIRPE
jgi:hypothetical protein